MTNTRYSKGHSGWEARTEIPLGFVRHDDWKHVDMPLVLQIRTSKSSSGGLTTIASVHAEHGGMVIMLLGQDFNERIEREPAARCTESNVRRMHENVLRQEHGIVTRAKAHYIGKPSLGKPGQPRETAAA